MRFHPPVIGYLIENALLAATLQSFAREGPGPEGAL